MPTAATSHVEHRTAARLASAATSACTHGRYIEPGVQRSRSSSRRCVASSQHRGAGCRYDMKTSHECQRQRAAAAPGDPTCDCQHRLHAAAPEGATGAHDRRLAHRQVDERGGKDAERHRDPARPGGLVAAGGVVAACRRARRRGRSRSGGERKTKPASIDMYCTPKICATTALVVGTVDSHSSAHHCGEDVDAPAASAARQEEDDDRQRERRM